MWCYITFNLIQDVLVIKTFVLMNWFEYFHICDRLRDNRAQRGMRKYREKIDRFLKNVLF